MCWTWVCIFINFIYLINLINFLDAIKNAEIRAQCERKAVKMGRELICNAENYQDISSVILFAKKLLVE